MNQLNQMNHSEVNLISELEFKNTKTKLKFYYNCLKKFYCKVTNENNEQTFPILQESMIFVETDKISPPMKINKLSSVDKFDLLTSTPKGAKLSQDRLILYN